MMREHPEPDEIIELARCGPESAAGRAVHAHCLVCDECQGTLRAILELRSVFARPVAPMPLPAAAAGMQ